MGDVRWEVWFLYVCHVTSRSIPAKCIFVTGGVISGLGKGISTASLALLLKSLGYTISVIKVDMYLNLDAGTINPLEHGEVFVTEDGLETDQDLGNYERFLNQSLHKHNYMTMGQVYYSVITRERQLKYEGEDVEGHIHIPEEIINRIFDTAEADHADVVLVEVGGTVGEYQNVMFFEAIRRLKQQFPQDIFIAHLVYLPKPAHIGELKSKPAQSSIYELFKLGLQPNLVICRSEESVDEKKKELIAFNAGIPSNAIIAAPDVPTIYQIPALFEEQGVSEVLADLLQETHETPLMDEWRQLVNRSQNTSGDVHIAIVGKYFNIGDASVLEDAYICVIEAIKHAAWSLGVSPIIQWFDVERLEDETQRESVEQELLSYDGIIVPQGWGSRGVEGKIATVHLARTHKIPYVGLCFGMQMAVIEFARTVCGLDDANSEEVNPESMHKVVHLMYEQKKHLDEESYGGTIRLGQWPCKISEDSLLYEAYKTYATYPSKVLKADAPNVVYERHRHRYEFNNKYREQLEQAGLVISGTSPDGTLVEAVELPKDKHPFFVGTQFHPEYQSRPLEPHPLFCAFIKAAVEK